MTNLKKALMGVTALVMAFSLTAITACTKKGGNEGGNGGNEGGNGGNGGGGTTVVADVDKIMEAAAKQTVGGITAAYTINNTINSTTYESDENGVKKPDAEEMTSVRKQKTVSSAKIDLNTLNIDASEVESTEESSIYGSYDYTTYGYSFIRDGKVFNYSAHAEVTDFTGKILTYNEDEASLGDFAGENVTLSMLGPVLTEEGVIGMPFNAVINLGKTYESTTFADGKLTINLNKVAYKAYNEVLAVIEGLTEESTMGGLIESTPVKNLIDSLTYGLTAKDLYDDLTAQVAGQPAAQEESTEAPGMASIFGMLPAPEEGASVHSYLVTVLKDETFSKAILSMAMLPEEAITAIGTLYAFPVITFVNLMMAMMPGSGDDIVGEGGDTEDMRAVPYEGEEEMPTLTMEQVKAMVKGMLDEAVVVTEDKATISVEGEVVELTGLAVELNVNDKYEIETAKFVCNYVNNFVYISDNGYFNGEEYVDNYSAEKSETTGSLVATLTLSATAPALTNINDNYVSDSDVEFEANGAYYCIVEVNEKELVFRVTLGEGEPNWAGSTTYQVTKIELLDKIGGSVLKSATEFGEDGVELDNGLTLTYWESDFTPGQSFYMSFDCGEEYPTQSSGALSEYVKVSDILKK